MLLSEEKSDEQTMLSSFLKPDLLSSSTFAKD